MLAEIIEKLSDDFQAKVKIGAELEFYTTTVTPLENIKNILGENDIAEEDGINQYEVRLGPSTDLIKFTNQLIQLQDKLKNNHLFKSSPKPSPDQPSNGLHLHINLLSLDGKTNLYKKNDDTENDLLLYSISGLLKKIKTDLRFFAPSVESQERYKLGMNNPTKICWGGNNRTTALRIPPPKSGDRRIEHRVPASDCKIKETITAILEAIYEGLASKELPPEKIHGNAFLDIYKAENIISNEIS